MKRIFILFFALCSLSVFADDFQQQWVAAEGYYKDGDYRNAAIAYEQLLQGERHSAELYYNLGNSYFKNGQIGLAVLNFEKALVLEPSMEDAEYNLNVAKARALDRIQSVPTFFLVNWVEGFGAIFSSNTWAVMALVFLSIAAAGALAWLLLGGALRRAGFTSLIVGGVFAVVSFLYSAAAYDTMVNSTRGVVLKAATVVRQSPDASSGEAFTIHEGTGFEIVGRSGDWCDIVIADGKRGWIFCNDIAEITI